jgi:hypothetical protein
MSMVLQLIAVPDAELEAVLADAERLEAMLEGEGDDAIAIVDLEKAWHGIHFLLTGTAWEGTGPKSLLLLGGKESTFELGYGPARGLRPAEVRAFREEVVALDEAEIGRRFDPKRMTALDIYPAVWDRDPEQERLVEFLADGLGQLQNLLDVAIKESAAVVIVMT